jgi:two-component system chemotaxis sensor kinase CheA
MDDLGEIIAEFLVESHENLDTLDRDLVALEQDPGSRDLLASIFRTIHTIKGTSGFLAFSRLEELTHVGENLLARLRDGQLTMTQSTTDVLLLMVDNVRALLDGIESSGSDEGFDVSEAVARVRAELDGPAGPGSAAEAAPAVEHETPAAPEPATAEAAVAGPNEAATPKARAPRRRTTTKAAAEPLAAEAAAEPESAGEPVVDKPATKPAVEPAPARPGKPARPARAAAGTPTAAGASGEHEDNGARRGVAESSVRVDVELLDTLMRLVGELVLTRNQVVRQATLNGNSDLLAASQRLNIIAGELQEGVMKTRMQPMEHIWSKFPRVVRDLGAQCGKSVTLQMIGRETELDRTLLDAVKDPLTHLVRNAVDHGLEISEARVAAGKAAQGTLTLRAFHQGGQVVVEVSDDGAGIDPKKIGASAASKGLVTAEELATMTSADALQLIFRPGFSTAAQVTNVSGRGVGMDVVKTNIENIGGSIEIESEPGRGTTCRLRIPLTLAIVPALTIDCGGNTYAVPQVNLLELVALGVNSQTGIEDVGGAEVYRLRGQLLPLIRLADLLGIPAQTTDGVIAVLQSEGRRFGLVVDRVVNTEDIVVKPLSKSLKAIGMYSGATILGDGRVSLILDVQCIARTTLKADAYDRLDEAKGSGAAISDEQRMLVVGIEGGRRIAIPLDSVTRLEEATADTIERVGSREVLRRQDQILPLVRLATLLGGYSSEQPAGAPVVVYSSGGRSVAMAVEEIIDIVDASDAVRSEINDLGLLGSLVVKDRVTELLDVRAAILAADPRFYAEELAGPDETVPGWDGTTTSEALV